jgi:hypothetical protein
MGAGPETRRRAQTGLSGPRRQRRKANPGAEALTLGFRFAGLPRFHSGRDSGLRFHPGRTAGWTGGCDLWAGLCQGTSPGTIYRAPTSAETDGLTRRAGCGWRLWLMGWAVPRNFAGHDISCPYKCGNRRLDAKSRLGWRLWLMGWALPRKFAGHDISCPYKCGNRRREAKSRLWLMGCAAARNFAGHSMLCPYKCENRRRGRGAGATTPTPARSAALASGAAAAQD